MTVYSTPAAPQHKFSFEGDRRFLTLELPSVESLHGIDLDIGKTEVRLSFPGSSEFLRIALPPEHSMNMSAPTAKFSRKRQQLIITWRSDPHSAHASPADVGQGPEELAVETGVAIEPANSILPAEEGKEPLTEEIEETQSDGFEFLRDEIEHVLKQCTVKKLKSIAAINGSSVMLSDFHVNGCASITRGLCKFKVSICFKWDVLDAFGGFLGATGIGEVSEFTEEHPSANVAIKPNKGGSFQAKTASEWMKLHGACLVGECLVGVDIASTVVSDWNDTVSEAAPKTKAPAVPLIKWSETWLEQKFSNLNVKLFGGSASACFAKPAISGEVMSCSKEGQPSPVFTLQVECAWTIVTATGQIEGTLLVPKFTSAQGAEAAIINAEVAPGQKASGQLLTAFRQIGVSAVRTLLDRFMSELQLQVKV